MNRYVSFLALTAAVKFSLWYMNPNNLNNRKYTIQEANPPHGKVGHRFIDRLHLSNLPIRCNATIKSIVSLSRLSPISPVSPLSPPSIDYKSQGPVLELYHSVRDARTVDDHRIKSIVRDGFKIPNYSMANKGNGVYLSSHSRYAWNWGGPLVLVCHVSANLPPNQMQRFRSEIKSGASDDNGWEYVVKDPKYVKPMYLIEYKVDCDDRVGLLHDSIGFVDHGKSGCKECDRLITRCDCALTPNFDIRDILT